MSEQLEKPKSANTKKRELKDFLFSEEVQASLKAVAAQILNPERLAAVLYQCVLKTPKLQECDPLTLVSAAKTLIQMGCEPDGIHGFLVPFNTRKKIGNDWVRVLAVTPIPTARGLARMARATGAIKSIRFGSVKKNDVFKWGINDSNFSYTHLPELWGNSEILGFYCSWTDGADSTFGVLMSKMEVDAIKARSKSMQTRDDKKEITDSPWVTDYEQMAFKTIVKRASKQWDLPADVAQAMQAADEDEFGSLKNVTPKKRSEMLAMMPPIPPGEEPEITDDDIPEADPMSEQEENNNPF